MGNSDRALQYAHSSKQLSVICDHGAHYVNTVTHEDWPNISDKAERRKIQNRLVQRRYRKKSDTCYGRTRFLISFPGQRSKERSRDLEHHSVSQSTFPKTRAATFVKPKSISALRATEVNGHRRWSTEGEACNEENTGDRTRQDAHRIQQDGTPAAHQYISGTSTSSPYLIPGCKLPSARDSMHDLNRLSRICCNCDARFTKHNLSTPAGSPLTVPDRSSLNTFPTTQDWYNKINRWQTKSSMVSISAGTYLRQTSDDRP
jgi:hypothetical protein